MRSSLALCAVVLLAVILIPFIPESDGFTDSEAIGQVTAPGWEVIKDTRITDDTEITKDVEYTGSLEIAKDTIVTVREGASMTVSGEGIVNGTLVIGQGASLKISGSLVNRGLVTVTGSGSQKAQVTVTGSFVNACAMHIDESGVLNGNIVAGKDSVTSVSGSVNGTVYTSGVAEIRGSVSDGIVLEDDGAAARICGTTSNVSVSMSSDRDAPSAVISPSAGHSMTGLVLTSVVKDGSRTMDVSGQVSSIPVSVNDRLRSTITLSGDCRISDTLMLERGTDLVVKGDTVIAGILDAMYPENTVKVYGKLAVKGVVDTVNTLQVYGKLDASRQLIEDDKGDFYRYTEKKSSGGVSIDIGVDAILIALIVIVCFLIVALLLTDPRIRRSAPEQEPADPEDEVQ